MIPLSLTELIALQDEARAIESSTAQPEIIRRARLIHDWLQGARERREAQIEGELNSPIANGTASGLCQEPQKRGAE